MKIPRITILNYFHWRSDPKYPVAIIYLMLYTFDRLRGLTDYARELGKPISMWVFPFIPCLSAGFLPIMLAFVLLISDAPFRTRQQGLIMQRTGKRAWLAGQLLYILSVSVGFTFLLIAFSWLWLLPGLEWTKNWGAVLRTAAINGVPGKYQVFLEFPYTVVKNTNPITVTLWCASAMTAVCFLLGLIMTFCNLWLRKGWGASITAIVTAISLITDYSATNPGPIRMLLWISPLNWMDYSIMGHTEQYLPSRAYAIYCPALLSAAISALLLLTIGKCNVETDKE